MPTPHACSAFGLRALAPPKSVLACALGDEYRTRRVRARCGRMGGVICNSRERKLCRRTTDVPIGMRWKVRDAIRLLCADGWFEVRRRGSLRQFKHGTKRGLVTVAGKPGDDLAPGTLWSALKEAGLK